MKRYIKQITIGVLIVSCVVGVVNWNFEKGVSFYFNTLYVYVAKPLGEYIVRTSFERAMFVSSLMQKPLEDAFAQIGTNLQNQNSGVK